MTLLAAAVHGRGLVAPDGPVFMADDEALLRGSAAFETLRVYDGHPFLLDRHVARLEHSAAALALPAPAGAAELALLVAGAAPPDHVLRLFRTEQTLLATAAALPPGLEDERAHGLALRTFERPPPALLAGVKSTSYAVSFAARREAARAGGDDVLFVADGRVLETTTANIWWCTGGTLYTPVTGPGVLTGVTRGVLQELADVDEGVYLLEDLLAADEAFVTSSVREVMPVVSVDGHPIGGGLPGPIAARLQAALRLRSKP